MDLVTLLMVWAVGVGIDGPSLCPERAAVSRHVAAIADADSGATRSSAVREIADPAIDRWQAFIDEAALRFGVPASWIRAVMATESSGQTLRDGRPITSSAGAIGLMPLIPETYAEMRLRHGLGADPYDPHDNIMAGVAYLRAMYDRYGYPGLFAAYNAGPARFDEYLLRGVSLPDQTLHYLLSIGPGLRDAVVAKRPRAAVQRAASDPRLAAPRSANVLFFPPGSSSSTRLRPSVGVTSRHVSFPDFGPGSPLSSGLFVPPASPSRSAGDLP
jgi:soluble lytic murein transglycosylase-like protein